MMSMSTKKEYTIEELEAQYNKTEESQRVLKEQIEQKKREEENLRKARLALEKENRKNEVNDAFENYKTLLEAYINDYGVYSYAADENIFDLFSSKFWNLII